MKASLGSLGISAFITAHAKASKLQAYTTPACLPLTPGSARYRGPITAWVTHIPIATRTDRCSRAQRLGGGALATNDTSGLSGLPGSGFSNNGPTTDVCAGARTRRCSTGMPEPRLEAASARRDDGDTGATAVDVDDGAVHEQ